MSIIELRVAGRYRLKQKIGNGSFGDIYLAQNVQTNEEVAVKMEDNRTKYPQLIYEAKVIHSLQAGIPQLIWCGQEGDYNILVMELLGDTLETCLNVCKMKIGMKSILMIMDQMLNILEYIHTKGFLHRDLKPENMLMGIGKKMHILHLIDYGLSKRFRDPKNNQHIPFKDGKQLTGTARYASINTHLGYGIVNKVIHVLEQSRRDDLESLGYVIVYLMKGSLPWQGLKAVTKEEKYQRILETKRKTPLESLCEGLPEEFIQFLTYARELKFEQKPDYHFLRRNFKELFIKMGYEFDYIYDWLLIPYIPVAKDVAKFDLNMDITVQDNMIVNKNLNIPIYDEDMDQKASDDSNIEGNNDPKKKAAPERLRTEFKEGDQAGPAKPIKPVHVVNLSANMSNARTPEQKKPNKEKEKEKDKCSIF